MSYTKEEVIEFITQEDVKFIRLAFCDWSGNQKNVAITPSQLDRAFDRGICFDGSAIPGFTDVSHPDLYLIPIPSTLTVLPWRSSSGKVVRMFCEVMYPDGTPFDMGCRPFLKRAVKAAKEEGISVDIATECEFYLFKTDENGEPTSVPFDKAGYLSVAPEDKGENIRREICNTLREMDIHPESSHHEEGPGQNEIDFRCSSALKSADNTMNFITVVKAASMRNGAYADFSPKPLAGHCGNGFHINMTVESDSTENIQEMFIAGILAHIKELTVFLNPTEKSYERLGSSKAPKYVSWGKENRSTLIRIPSSDDDRRFEIRSPDPSTNPYVAYAVLIFAGLDGVKNKMKLPDPVEVNLFTARPEVTEKLEKLPENLYEAERIAENSDFVKSIMGNCLEAFMKRPL